MDLRVDRASPVSLSDQLAGRIQSAIARRELNPGDRLPSIREAAAAAGVNVNTVRAVYARLEAAGLLATEHGRGTFVSEPAAETRRELRRQIERLEAELVRLPAPRPQPGSPRPRASSSPSPAGLLSTEELQTVRDSLLDRLRELDAARAEVVQRLESLERGTIEVRSPTRSTSTLSGARVRWSGAG